MDHGTFGKQNIYTAYDSTFNIKINYAIRKTLYFILGIDFTITLLQGIFQVTLRYFEWIKQYGGPVIV